MSSEFYGGYPAGVSNSDFYDNNRREPAYQPRIPVRPESVFDDIFKGTLHRGSYTYDRGKGVLQLELLVMSLDGSAVGMDDAAIETVRQFLRELERAQEARVEVAREAAVRLAKVSA